MPFYIFELQIMAMENFIIITFLVVAIYFIIKKANLFSNNELPKSSRKYYTADDQYNADKIIRKKEVDRILDKIGKKGIKSLTVKEKERLEDYSKK